MIERWTLHCYKTSTLYVQQDLGSYFRQIIHDIHDISLAA